MSRLGQQPFKGSKFYHQNQWPCCAGTLPQVAADYGISTYLRGSDGIYVNLYIPSTVVWPHDGVRTTLTQAGDYRFGSLARSDGLVAADQLDADHEAAPADLADRGQALDVLGQQLAEEVDLGRQALECVLLLEDAQGRERRRRPDGEIERSPGGTLAFTVGTHAFPHDVDPFFLEIQTAYKAVGMPWPGDWPPPPPDRIPDWRAEIEASGLFEDIQVARYLWTDEYDADSHVDLMQTASDHRLLEEKKREWLFAEMRRLIAARPHGRITKHQLTMLHLARRRG